MHTNLCQSFDLLEGIKIQSPGYNEAHVHGTFATLGNFFMSMESGSRKEKPEPTPGSYVKECLFIFNRLKLLKS